MRANVNKGYAEAAMDVIEQITASAFVLALHRYHGFGAKRLNELKRQATETVSDYVKHYATEGQYRGNKYKQGAILLDAMLRDVEAIGVEVKT